MPGEDIHDAYTCPRGVRPETYVFVSRASIGAAMGHFKDRKSRRRETDCTGSPVKQWEQWNPIELDLMKVTRQGLTGCRPVAAYKAAGDQQGPNTWERAAQD